MVYKIAYWCCLTMDGVEEFNTTLLDSSEEKRRLRHTQRAGILPDQQYETLNHSCTVCLTLLPGQWGPDRI